MDVKNELFRQVKYDMNLWAMLERFILPLPSVWHFYEP